VEIHEPPANAVVVCKGALMGSFLGAIDPRECWRPSRHYGCLLWQHEAVRDRFIRIAGGADIRATHACLNDAVSTAVTILRLAVPGQPWRRASPSPSVLPSSGSACLLWGALPACLRFVPYVGVWIAALFAGGVAAAVDPGWTLYHRHPGAVHRRRIVAGQLVEPQLYANDRSVALSVVVGGNILELAMGQSSIKHQLCERHP